MPGNKKLGRRCEDDNHAQCKNLIEDTVNQTVILVNEKERRFKNIMIDGCAALKKLKIKP